MMTKVRPKTMSDHFWRPVILAGAAASSSAASTSDSFMPPLVHHVLLLLQRQEGGALVGLHLLGVAITKMMEMAMVTSQKMAPSAMMMAWFTAMPMPEGVDSHADGERFTVEPRTPQPAPSSTTAAPVRLSKPAATMVAASSR